MASGLSPGVVAQLNGLLGPSHLVALQAGGIGGGNADGPVVKLEPGGVLAVPLMTGDSEMTAIGTVTDVIRDATGHERVVGFGHSFNNEGPIALPMGVGRINAVIANLTTSFKIGALSDTVGTLLSDETVGVAGRVGAPPAMIPVELNVAYADGSGARTYHFQIAQHPKLTPMLAATAFMAAASGAHDPPQFYTADYDLNLDFTNGQSVKVANRTVNAAVGDLFTEVGVPLTVAAENPFERVGVKAITGTLKISSEAREVSGGILGEYVLVRRVGAGQGVTDDADRLAHVGHRMPPVWVFHRAAVLLQFQRTADLAAHVHVFARRAAALLSSLAR